MTDTITDAIAELAAMRQRAESAEAAADAANRDLTDEMEYANYWRQRAEEAQAVADRLWEALMWIDTSAPEITAAAETKFGLDISRATLRQDEVGE